MKLVMNWLQASRSTGAKREKKHTWKNGFPGSHAVGFFVEFCASPQTDDAEQVFEGQTLKLLSCWGAGCQYCSHYPAEEPI